MNPGLSTGGSRPIRFPHTPYTAGTRSHLRAQMFFALQLRRIPRTQPVGVRYTSGKTASGDVINGSSQLEGFQCGR